MDVTDIQVFADTVWMWIIDRLDTLCLRKVSGIFIYSTTNLQSFLILFRTIPLLVVLIWLHREDFDRRFYQLKGYRECMLRQTGIISCIYYNQLSAAVFSTVQIYCQFSKKTTLTLSLCAKNI